MSSRRLSTFASLFLLTAAARGAPTAYDLRGPLESPGQIVQIRSEWKMPDGTFTTEEGGEVFRGGISHEGVTVYESEVVQADGRQLTMLKQRTPESWTRHRSERDGAEGESTEDDPLVGATVLAERTENGWRRTLLGSEPSAQQKAQLRRPYDLVEVYPKQPVKVGESWVIEGSRLAMLYGFGDALSVDGKATYTLDRVVTEGGESRAWISYRSELRVKKLDENQVPNEITFGGSGKIKRSLKTYVDLSEHFSGQRTWAATLITDKGKKSQRSEAGPLEVETTTRRIAPDARAEVVRRATAAQPPPPPRAAESKKPKAPKFEYRFPAQARPESARPSAPSRSGACQGFALACNARSDLNCTHGSGCFAAGQCSGWATERCFGKGQFSCGSTPGCFWQAWSKSCGGTITCQGKGQFQCGAISGCRWQGGCGGVATPCSLLTSLTCALQPGCSLQ